VRECADDDAGRVHQKHGVGIDDVGREAEQVEGLGGALVCTWKVFRAAGLELSVSLGQNDTLSPKAAERKEILDHFTGANSSILFPCYRR
jgi:hypothetical protein